MEHSPKIHNIQCKTKKIAAESVLIQNLKSFPGHWKYLCMDGGRTKLREKCECLVFSLDNNTAGKIYHLQGYKSSNGWLGCYKLMPQGNFKKLPILYLKISQCRGEYVLTGICNFVPGWWLLANSLNSQF